MVFHTIISTMCASTKRAQVASSHALSHGEKVPETCALCKLHISSKNKLHTNACSRVLPCTTLHGPTGNRGPLLPHPLTHLTCCNQASAARCVYKSNTCDLRISPPRPLEVVIHDTILYLNLNATCLYNDSHTNRCAEPPVITPFHAHSHENDSIQGQRTAGVRWTVVEGPKAEGI